MQHRWRGAASTGNAKPSDGNSAAAYSALNKPRTRNFIVPGFCNHTEETGIMGDQDGPVRSTKCHRLLAFFYIRDKNDPGRVDSECEVHNYNYISEAVKCGLQHLNYSRSGVP